MPYHPHRKVKPLKHPVLDLVVSVVAIVTPIMTLPQVYLIYSTKNVEGISVVSWIGYTLASGIWTAYGLAHGDKPIIINSVFGGILSLFVVIGALLYG